MGEEVEEWPLIVMEGGVWLEVVGSNLKMK